MNFRKRTVETVTVVELFGRLDAHQCQKLDAQLAAELTLSGHTVMNLSQVHFIDSTGLSLLVRLMKHHREASGDMVICALQQPVRIIFELTRLDRVFGIYATEAEAIHGCQTLELSVVA